MKRNVARARVEEVVAPMLGREERVRDVARTWAVEPRGRAPLLFQGRDRYAVVITDHRLVLLEAPQRRRPLTISQVKMAKRFSHFTCERLRRVRPMLQVRLRTADERLLVLEFGPRDRAVSRHLLEAVGRPEPPPTRRGERRRRQDEEAAAARADLLDTFGP